jgi:lipid-A-disaccharide synthase
MTSRPKVFVSAGEVSGDAILGSILKLLRQRFPDMELRGLGGSAAAASGLEPLFPMARTAFSGAWDVLRNARFALGMYVKASAELRRFKPDLVLLVDYPGLNLRLARLARSLGVPVLFVAPPQAWVYKNPERKLRRARGALRGAAVHVLFPFEKSWYEGAAGEISVGHFLEVPASRAEQEQGFGGGARAGARTPGLTCLCPGSRLPVLRRNLPVWLTLLRQSPQGLDSRYAVLVPPHLKDEAQRLVASHSGWNGIKVEVRTDKSALLGEATAAIAFPGTVTLELALGRVPTLVLAIVDPFTLALGRRVLGDSRLALPNLILGEEVFPEWVGMAPGPTAEVFRELLGRRDGVDGWGGWLEKLRVGIGVGGGMDASFQSCLNLLKRPKTN